MERRYHELVGTYQMDFAIKLRVFRRNRINAAQITLFELLFSSSSGGEKCQLRILFGGLV